MEYCNDERIAFEKHCDEEKHFYCPLCEDYHKKTKTLRGTYKTIWWCQSPI